MLVAYAAATLLFTWPLAGKIRSHFPAASHPSTRDDGLLLAWVLSWDVHQLLRDPLHLFDANIFHPLRHTLGYSEALVSQALPLLLLAPLTPNPALLHNVALLLSFVIGALGAFLLLRHLTGDPLAAFLGGLMFAFAPYRFWQIDRLQSLSVHWTPFVLLALHVYLERGGRRPALALAGAFILQALASVYVAYASAVLLALFLLVWPAVGPRAGRARILRAAGILALAGGGAALVYVPYTVVRAEMVLARDPLQVVVHSMVPVELGRALVSMPHYLARKIAAGERGGGTLGFVAAALMWFGVFAAGRTGRLYGLLTLAALLLSFGPVVVLPWGNGEWVSGPYRLLYDWAPGFTALREPRRWMGFVVACGTLAAGLGTAALLATMRGRAARTLVAGGVAALIVLEVGWRPLPLDPAPVPGDRAPLYRALASAPGAGAVAELPIGSEHEEAVDTFRSAYHLRPLLNGYSGFRPTTAELRRRLRRFPDRRTVSLLRRLGVRFILYDTTRPGARPARTLARRVRRGDPTAAVRGIAGGAVLIELEPLPPERPARGIEVSRAGWRASASTPGAAAGIDGDLATHWTAGVDPDAGGGWYEVDLGGEADFDRVEIELDAHYGEYPRAWRVRARDGDREWVVASRRYAPAPLVSYRADHRRVVVELPLPATRARALRIEVPSLRLPSRPPPFDVPQEHWHWERWGIHELRLYRHAREAAPARTP